MFPDLRQQEQIRSQRFLKSRKERDPLYLVGAALSANRLELHTVKFKGVEIDPFLIITGYQTDSR